MTKRIAAVVKSINDFLRELEVRIDKLVPDDSYPHDAFVIIALQEAIAAALEGNFGVGAVLIRNRKEIVQRGHNRVFSPHFRSDMHAEMDVMTRFEERHKKIERMGGYTLFSSLEPCPMCLGRLIISGVREVYYAALDRDGGMASRLGYLPNEWKELAQRQDFRLADCSSELSEIALQVFMSTVEANDNRLRQR